MTFRLKITLSMLCLLAMLFGFGGSTLISISFQNALEQEKDSAKDRHQMLVSTLTVVGNLDGNQNTSSILRSLEQFSASGAPAWSALRLSSPTETLYQDGAGAAELPGFAAQTDGEHGLISYFRSKNGTPFLQFSSMLAKGDDSLYLDTAYDLSTLYEARTRQQRVYQKILLGLLILCALGAYSISWLLTRPLYRLSRASKQIALGNLTYRSRIHSNDEVGALSADFDSMADQVEKSISDLTCAMERQEQFMASFTHELKTPMTTIIGYGDLLRGQTLTAEEQADAANYIFTEGKRLESLSLKLLNIFVIGQQELKLTPVSPLNIAQTLAERLRPAYEILQTELQCVGEDGRCLLDPDLVGSLLINLLENARKALPEKGCIEIRIKLLPDGCQIIITDNGRGIPTDALTHLTEAFYRVDKARSRAQGGVGLGLALCAKIAQLHGGELHFESEPGVGTCVTATLRGGRP